MDFDCNANPGSKDRKRMDLDCNAKPKGNLKPNPSRVTLTPSTVGPAPAAPSTAPGYRPDHQLACGHRSLTEVPAPLEHPKKRARRSKTSRHTKDLKTRCNPFDRRPLWHYGQTGFTLLSGPWCDYRSNCGSTILGSGSLVCHRPRVLPITMEGPALGHKGLQSHGPVFGLGPFPGIKFLQARIPRAS